MIVSGRLKVEAVYVAASSDPNERTRAQHWIDHLAAAGITCTSPWIKSIEKHGERNPSGADKLDVRKQVSLENTAAIEAAQILWVLAPPSGVHTCGAWWESGYASALKMPVIYSGIDTERSVFTSLGFEHKNDLSAFASICRLSKEGLYL